MLESAQVRQLISLRQALHANPELSGCEEQTASRIVDFIGQFSPNSIIRGVGGHGVAAIWQGQAKGDTILIRAELDALPIHETNTFDHKSAVEGVSHKCGHDGHMTILCGLAMMLDQAPLPRGKVVLLFQPSEETGQGAQAIVNDPEFKKLRPNYAFALHNLPRFEIGDVLCKKGSFCAASTGLKITLTGKTAHASQPETGINPALATARLIYCLNRILDANEFTNKTLITLTHTKIGEQSFGVSAGEAEIWLTLRAFEKHDFDLLTSLVEKEATDVAEKHGLQISLSHHESFEVTQNDPVGYEIVKNAATKQGISFTEMTAPNPWSEDFGLFLKSAKGAMFGLGSGTDTPDLHNPDYDFPDELIETGVKMFWEIIKQLTTK